MMLSKKCADAFKAAGLSTPAEIIRDKGRTFIHFDEFKSLTDNLKSMGFTEEMRAKIRGHGNDTRISATTIDPNDVPDMSVTTILYDWSFNDTSHEFSEVMPHEQIHGAGVPPTRKWWQIGPFAGHDLNGYDSYDNILKNCRSPEKK